MKVYIGPYKNWYGPYHIAGLLSYVGFSDETVDKVGDWLHKIGVEEVCKFIYGKIDRTTIVKIDKYDTWGMDNTLALIIVPMLKQLKATKYGTPMAMFDETMLGDPTEEEHAKAENKWNNILEKMIWSFEQIIDDNWEDKYLISTNPYEFDVIGMKNHNDKIQEGLELFGKHYCSLWD